MFVAKNQKGFIMENDVPKEWGDNLMFLNWPESALKIITA